MTRLIVPFFIAHQGCPHRCAFCDQARIAGGAGGLPSGEEIIAKVSAWRKPGHSPVEVAFYGGSFTALPRSDQERLLAPLQPLLATGEIAAVRVSTRPDAIDPEIAGFLRGMGVTTVELGIQSLDDLVLALAERGHTAAQVRGAFAVLHGAGLAIGAQLMPGLPGDSHGLARATLERVLELRPAFLRIYPTVVLAGTRLEELLRRGAYRPLTLDEAVSLCKLLLHRALQAGVPVIRMGLQPTDELSQAGTVVAGPYHPAFRQLVESALFLDLMERLVAGIDGEATLFCHPARISDLTGQKGENLRRLWEGYYVQVGGIRPDATLGPYDLIIEAGAERRGGNVVTNLDYVASSIRSSPQKDSDGG